MKKLLFVSLVLVIILTGCVGVSQPVNEVTVVASDFAYIPNTIYIPIGEEVTITFRNDGQVEHDFVVTEINLAGADEHMEESAGEHMDELMNEHMDEEMGMDEHAEHAVYAIHALTMPGNSTTIKFTALEIGEYEIFCTVQGHRDAGMIGKLTVVDQN
jgi:uncharacterized cupredoxin-like copper-binding protein